MNSKGAIRLLKDWNFWGPGFVFHANHAPTPSRRKELVEVGIAEWVEYVTTEEAERLRNADNN